jgi:hypothetical protein
VFELYEITPEGVRLFELLYPGRIPQSAELSNLHITRGEIRRVAYLSPSSLLTEMNTEIELRVWDRFQKGEVWASWQK